MPVVLEYESSNNPIQDEKAGRAFNRLRNWSAMMSIFMITRLPTPKVIFRTICILALEVTLCCLLSCARTVMAGAYRRTI